MDKKVETPEFQDRGIWGNPFVIGQGWRLFRVGTCHGTYRRRTDWEILAIANDNPGNGCVELALAYFYRECKREKKNLLIHEVMDDKLRDKLIRYGFTCKINNDYIKRFGGK